MIAKSYKTKIRAACSICLLAALGIMSGPAVLQAQSYDSAAQNEIRLQQLEKEVRNLTGQIEEQNYKIKLLEEELAKATGDMDVRLKDFEHGAVPSISSPPVDEPPMMDEMDAGRVSEDESFSYTPPEDNRTLGTISRSAETGAVTTTDPPARAYEYAYSFVKEREFDRAEQEFSKFINTYPDHPLVSNAKYWYGETFYVRGSYDKAARIFAEGYQKYPNGPKASSNLLKLGMALTGMGKTDDACIAFKQLKKDYSNAAVPVLKRADTEMERINCR